MKDKNISFKFLYLLEKPGYLLLNTKKMYNKKSYHKLIVWQRAHELTIEIYKATSSFPKTERYGLISQLRRSAVSVAANIVEGQTRGRGRDFRRFLIISDGSLAEVEYYLELSLALNYLNEGTYQHLETLRRKTAYLLNQMIKSQVA